MHTMDTQVLLIVTWVFFFPLNFIKVLEKMENKTYN